MEEARRRIAYAKAEHPTTLYLNKFGLTELPPEVREMTHLTELWCNGNKLASLAGLDKLTNLTRLECENNQLASLDGLDKTKLSFLDKRRIHRDLRDMRRDLATARLVRESVPRERLKLCICGFGGAGKSQLLRSLQDKQSPLFAAKDNPRSLQERTPGVAAQRVSIGGCKFSALDFGAKGRAAEGRPSPRPRRASPTSPSPPGGQPEFYLTQVYPRACPARLRCSRNLLSLLNLDLPSPLPSPLSHHMFLAQRDAAFVLVMRLDLERDEIRRRALYWLRFIRACAARAAAEGRVVVRPWVVLVGSRAAAPTLAAGEGSRRLSELVAWLTPKFAQWLEISADSARFALDCRRGPSKQEGMRALIATLATRHAQALKGATLPKLCNSVQDKLSAWVEEGKPIWTVAEVADRLIDGKGGDGDGELSSQAERLRADDHSLMRSALTYLHMEGDVAYDLGEAEALRDIVIIDPQWLCGELLASLTLPPALAHARGQLACVEADEDGKVALEAVGSRFPHFEDPRTLLRMLEHFDMCCPIKIDPVEGEGDAPPPPTHWRFPGLARRPISDVNTRDGECEQPWSAGTTFVGRRFACADFELDMFPRALFPTFAVLLRRDRELREGEHSYYRGGVRVRPSGSAFSDLELLVQPSNGAVARNLDSARELWRDEKREGRRFAHEGPLRKLSEHRGVWKQRHLRIKGHELRNFTDDKREWDDDRRRRFDLHRCTVAFDEGRALCFSVTTTKGERWLLEARTERERRGWARAIKAKGGEGVTIQNVPEDVDIEELDAPAIDVRVRGRSYEEDPAVYEKCEALVERVLSLLRDAHRRVCEEGTADVVVGALSLGDQERHKTQADLPALTAAFDLEHWDDKSHPLKGDNDSVRWCDELEKRVELLRGSGFYPVHQRRREEEEREAERRREEEEREAERRREAHEVAATHQLEFAALRRTVLESQSKTIDELRSGVGHIVSKLDAAMQLSFELEQKGVPSRLQLLPRDVESGGSVRERFAAGLSRSLRASGVTETFRLLVLCEGDLESECCRYEGAEGLAVSFPGATLRRALPLLKLTSGLLHAASLAGTVVGLKLPPGLPWLSEVDGGRERLEELMAPINDVLDVELRKRNEREASGQDKYDGPTVSDAIASVVDRRKGIGEQAKLRRTLDDGADALAGVLKAKTEWDPHANECFGLTKAYHPEQGKVVWLCADCFAKGGFRACGRVGGVGAEAEHAVPGDEEEGKGEGGAAPGAPAELPPPSTPAMPDDAAPVGSAAATLLRDGVPVLKSGRSVFNRGPKEYTLQANAELTHLHWRERGAVGEPREEEKRFALADVNAVRGEGRMAEVAFRRGGGRALRLTAASAGVGERLRSAIRELGGRK